MSDERLIDITDPASDRYSTMRMISWWEQSRIQQACVLVVGAGALGNEVLKNLALLGTGRIVIVDLDHVEAANLSRSVLFRLEDSGRPKVDVVAERIRELNPDVQVSTIHGNIITDVGLGVFRRADAVFGCLDNRAARLAVNRACWRVGTPWIDGALDVLMGMARIFVPPDSACYECTMTEQDYELLETQYGCRPDRHTTQQGYLPTTPTSASIVAALQVQEGVKLLHQREIPPGVGVYFNGHKLSMSTLQYSRRADCGSHVTYEGIIELDARSDDLSVRELLNRAEDELQQKVVLLSDLDVVQTLTCQRCQKSQDVYQPFDEVVPEQIRCPQCGTNRIPSVTNRFAADELPEAVTLRQIGVPPLHVLRLDSGTQTHYIELAGDAETFFQ